MKISLSTLTPKSLVTKIALLCLFQIALTTSLMSQTIQFSLHDGTALTDTGSFFDNQDSLASFTQNGITLSMEAFLDDNSVNAELNGGAEGFGVNSNGLNDHTQRIDNTNGKETIIFSFNSPGILSTIDLRYIEESSNEAILSFEGGNQFNLNTETALSNKDDFTINEAFTAGQQISLFISSEASENENFALESITIQIPENNEAILGMFTFILLFVSFKKMSKKLN